MELRQLEIFRILSRELNFTRTAEKAHCVQSNVSVQIRSIEKELGVQLFERLGQKVHLTPQGERLLPYAERVLRLLEEARTAVRSGKQPSGRLVIGSPESVLTYRLPRVLRSFRARFPNVELVFHSSRSSELILQLERGEIDLGLVIDDVFHDPRFHIERLCAEAVVLLAPARHALLARRRKLSAEDIYSETFLLTDAGCAYRAKLERALVLSNHRPKAIIEFSSVETIKRCAALGMGIACLPAIVARQELAAGTLSALRWKGPDLAMSTLAFWHSDKWLSPAMEAFLSLLRSALH
jgi:DNA-binding transcriptional LysR family regulator